MNTKRLLSFTVAALIALTAAGNAYGPIEGPGGDSNAVLFDQFAAANISPQLVGNGSVYNPPSQINPNNIVLPFAATLRVYFLGDFAAFNNNFGLVTNGTAAPSPANEIFSQTLGVGLNQYVTLGNFAAGTLLNFFLQPNQGLYTIDGKVAAGSVIFWNNRMLSEPLAGDQAFNHVIVTKFFNPANDATYIVMGWEDESVADNSFNNDHNDLYVVLEAIPIQVPEPATYLILGSVLAIGLALRHRRNVRLVS